MHHFEVKFLKNNLHKFDLHENLIALLLLEPICNEQRQFIKVDLCSILYLIYKFV